MWPLHSCCYYYTAASILINTHNNVDDKTANGHNLWNHFDGFESLTTILIGIMSACNECGSIKSMSTQQQHRHNYYYCCNCFGERSFAFAVIILNTPQFVGRTNVVSFCVGIWLLLSFFSLFLRSSFPIPYGRCKMSMTQFNLNWIEREMCNWR